MDLQLNSTSYRKVVFYMSWSHTIPLNTHHPLLISAQHKTNSPILQSIASFIDVKLQPINNHEAVDLTDSSHTLQQLTLTIYGTQMNNFHQSMTLKAIINDHLKYQSADHDAVIHALEPKLNQLLDAKSSTITKFLTPNKSNHPHVQLFKNLRLHQGLVLAQPQLEAINNLFKPQSQINHGIISGYPDPNYPEQLTVTKPSSVYGITIESIDNTGKFTYRLIQLNTKHLYQDVFNINSLPTSNTDIDNLIHDHSPLKDSDVISSKTEFDKPTQIRYDTHSNVDNGNPFINENPLNNY